MLSTLLKHFYNNHSLGGGAIFLCFIAFISGASHGCGKRKPPLPPVERVTQRIEIEGFQRGNQIRLSWLMPARNATASDITNIARIDVYRLSETIQSSQTLSEEEFAARSTLVASIPVAEIDFGLKKFNYTDILDLAGQNARLRYGIRAVNSSGQKASFSNFLLIEPTAKVADAPRNLIVAATETANKLNWQPARANVDGSQPVNILGYNIYRSSSEKEVAALLNNLPFSGTEFLDKDFEFDKNYFYFIRSVSLGNAGEPLESVESNIVAIQPKDVFPPASPSSLTIAAAPNNLSIFFAANVESDTVGYRVYRSTDKTLTLSEWKNLTPVLLTTNTFQDKDVESGKTYYYYITAVDKAGNVSKPSEIVFETLP